MADLKIEFTESDQNLLHPRNWNFWRFKGGLENWKDTIPLKI